MDEFQVQLGFASAAAKTGAIAISRPLLPGRFFFLTITKPGFTAGAKPASFAAFSRPGALPGWLEYAIYEYRVLVQPAVCEYSVVTARPKVCFGLGRQIEGARPSL
jgi:hypothetical protein